MKKKSSHSFLGFALATIATQASANPFLQAKCPLPSIKAPDNGTGVMFDEECKTAYILPPVAGEARLSSLASTTNLNFCPAVLKVGSVATSTLNTAEIIAKKIEKMITDFEPLDKAREDQAKDVGLLLAEQSAAKIILDNARSQDSKLFSAKETAATEYNTCSVTATDAAVACKDAKANWDATKWDYKKFITDVLSPAQSAHNKSKLAFDRASVELGILASRYNEAITPALELQNKLFDLNTKVGDLYRQYTALEGVTGQVIYRIAWDKLLQDYQASNPNLNVFWEKMPVKSANLFAVIKLGSNATETTLPALLRSSIAGGMATGPAAPFAREGQTLPALSSASPSPDDSERVIGFGSSVSGQIVLSLAGSCPYYENGLFENKTEISAKDLVAHMSPNLEYTYEIAARRGYTASYQMSNFISRVEKKTVKGGFLSAKNINSIVEDSNSSDWFTIDFNAEAREFQYSPAEQTEIIREAKNTLIERALRNFASINSLSTMPPALPEVAGQTGAGAAAKNLHSACGWNFYCRAGSYFLNTVDAIWGSKTAVSEFKKNNNLWVSDHVNGIQILDRSTFLTFDAKK